MWERYCHFSLGILRRWCLSNARFQRSRSEGPPGLSTPARIANRSSSSPEGRFGVCCTGGGACSRGVCAVLALRVAALCEDVLLRVVFMTGSECDGRAVGAELLFAMAVLPPSITSRCPRIFALSNSGCFKRTLASRWSPCEPVSRSAPAAQSSPKTAAWVALGVLESPVIRWGKCPRAYAAWMCACSLLSMFQIAAS